MDTIEHVETVADTPDTSLRVRFIRNASENPKAPRYNALVWMPFPLTDVVSTFPIFQNAADGGYSVTLPGNKGFPTFKAANLTHADGSLLADTSSKGKANLDSLQQAIKDAFYVYRKTGDADQRINVGA